MDFKTFIKAVGTGPKGNRDLSIDEACEAVAQILQNKPTRAQMGAFLIAWRTKLESQDEFKGAIKALKSFMKFKKVDDSIELGYNFDGRNNNPYLFPLYENILNNFFQKNKDVRRLNFVISGDLLQPTKKGITTKDIFKNFDEGQYLHYFDRVEYLNELSAITPLRHEFGLRTAFNTVEKALNPGLSEYAVVGAFHKPYVSKYIDMYEEYFKDMTVIRGSEGDIEIFKEMLSIQQELSGLKEAVTNAVNKKDSLPSETDKRIGSAEVCRLLHISKSTLKAYREKKVFSYVKIGSRYNYSAKEINDLMKPGK